MPRLTGIAFAMALGVATAVSAQDPGLRGPFAGAGGGGLVQTEADAFGGYFCCKGNGGAAVPAVWVEAGGWLTRAVGVGAEVTGMRAFTTDITAPRFVQATRHRDTFLAGVLAWRPRGLRAGVIIVAGGGVALSRTRRASRLLDFGMSPPRAPEEPSIFDVKQATRLLTAGVDVAWPVGGYLTIVPRVRAIYVSRDEDARAQDGLGHWAFVTGVGLRVGR
jgi:hypothetical protein